MHRQALSISRTAGLTGYDRRAVRKCMSKTGQPVYGPRLSLRDTHFWRPMMRGSTANLRGRLPSVPDYVCRPACTVHVQIDATAPVDATHIPLVQTGVVRSAADGGGL